MNKIRLKQIAEFAFKTMFRQAPELSKIEETFYGWVVFLASKKVKVVVKFSREIGRLAKEVEGLDRLRSTLPCPVPRVLFFGREEGFNFLMLEWVDGVPAHQLPDDSKAITAFRNSYTELLLTLHDKGSESGFEVETGVYTLDLIDAFDGWMHSVYRYLMSEASPFSPSLKAAYKQLWEIRGALLSDVSSPASLVHDDCHVGNVMFDPKTFKVSAILDPCDVGFKHREMDLFHLYDVRPELNLAEHYRTVYPLESGFEVRRWFYSLWDDAKHSRNMGWYDEEWMLKKFDNFNRVYNQYY
ncbi:phosphotransferase [Photobacterium nomapromontoriensis]|uniref:phosphotransferase n=1 Tax=Photobacterium nomapromontoriensis TaxID=2910237 RepID=UPI003D0EA1B6